MFYITFENAWLCLLVILNVTRFLIACFYRYTMHEMIVYDARVP